MGRLTDFGFHQYEGDEQEMTNQSALGYMILAMKHKGYSDEQIREMEGAMLYMMDMKTEKEAAEAYYQF